MSKASEQVMGALHGKLARVCIDALESTEEPIFDNEGKDTGKVKVIKPHPAWGAVARALLKDNSVFVAAEQSEAISELAEKLKARRRAGPTQRDLKEALGKVGSELLQ